MLLPTIGPHMISETEIKEIEENTRQLKNDHQVVQVFNKLLQTWKTAISFESEETFNHFFQLLFRVCSQEESNKRIIPLFIKKVTLQNKEEPFLLSNKEHTFFLTCSKQRLTSCCSFFQEILNPHFKEAEDQIIELNLSNKAMQSFKTFVDIQKLELTNLDDTTLYELWHFARMISYDSLKDSLALALIDPGLTEDQLSLQQKELIIEFTQSFLEREKIKSQSLPSGNYAISISAYGVLFSKSSKFLHILAKGIKGVWLDTSHFQTIALIALTPGISDYPKLVTVLIPDPQQDFKPSPNDLREIKHCFPNIYI